MADQPTSVRHWRIPLLASGAITMPDRGAGHVRVLGCCYAWQAFDRCWGKWQFTAWGLFAVGAYIHDEWCWSFGKLSITWRRAESRFYDVNEGRKRQRICEALADE